MCRICNKVNNSPMFVIRESMYGLDDTFEYFQCQNCFCLQIKTIPTNISKYYQPNYYSLTTLPNKVLKKARYLRDRYVIKKKGLIGYYLNKIKPNEALFSLAKILTSKCISILDVGCGTGADIESLSQIGFKNVLGIDPNLPSDIAMSNSGLIKKMELSNINGSWDIIMMNHSLEHISDQQGVFFSLAKLLSGNGTVIIRIPTVSSTAWEKYGVHWIQIDAPRHFYLHSLKSIELLADKFGFKIVDKYFDSSDFQFWGSEQWKIGIPLKSEKSYKINSFRFNTAQSIFSRKDILRFKQDALLCNMSGKGDQVVLYLSKK